mmetsp:Transcript_10600/g.28245  ORF Transcript_10600/g.28245 Transcript_10600/m.28245 type:complete len:344 (-) Transcript_10600:455-1486(-)
MQRAAWEAANNVRAVGGGNDVVYRYDAGEQRELLAAKPWARDAHYFKRVHISAIALIKMVMHARSGGSIEVMGVMQGKLIENAFVIMDAFPLPVEGTETRVNAQIEGYEFMVSYQEQSPRVGREENVVGWYHSHPGYGCWLSGIDVQTQTSNQQYQDPFLAIVIDPLRTMSSGRVDIGAFRTFPQGYWPESGGQSGGGSGRYQSIPLAKIEDFGVHCNSYYSLEVSCFKSTLDEALLDALWDKYWAATLSTTAQLQSQEYTIQQLRDLSQKVSHAQSTIESSGRHARSGYLIPQRDVQVDGHLDRIAKDSQKLASEQLQALLALSVKDQLFAPPSATSPSTNS